MDEPLAFLKKDCDLEGGSCRRRHPGDGGLGEDLEML